MHTPIPRILEALEGKVEFIKATTPGLHPEKPERQSADDMKAILRAARPV